MKSLVLEVSQTITNPTFFISFNEQQAKYVCTVANNSNMGTPSSFDISEETLASLKVDMAGGSNILSVADKVEIEDK